MRTIEYNTYENAIIVKIDPIYVSDIITVLRETAQNGNYKVGEKAIHVETCVDIKIDYRNEDLKASFISGVFAFADRKRVYHSCRIDGLDNSKFRPKFSKSTNVIDTTRFEEFNYSYKFFNNIVVVVYAVRGFFERAAEGEASDIAPIVDIHAFFVDKFGRRYRIDNAYNILNVNDVDKAVIGASRMNFTIPEECVNDLYIANAISAMIGDGMPLKEGELLHDKEAAKERHEFGKSKVVSFDQQPKSETKAKHTKRKAKVKDELADEDKMSIGDMTKNKTETDNAEAESQK